jgi:hypothetical protein
VTGLYDAVEKGGSARKGDGHASARSGGQLRVVQGRLLVGTTGRELGPASHPPDRRSPGGKSKMGQGGRTGFVHVLETTAGLGRTHLFILNARLNCNRICFGHVVFGNPQPISLTSSQFGPVETSTHSGTRSSSAEVIASRTSTARRGISSSGASKTSSSWI